MYINLKNKINERYYNIVFEILNILEKIDIVKELGFKLNLDNFIIDNNIIKFSLNNNSDLIEITNNITSKYLVITIYKDRDSYVYTVDINTKEIIDNCKYINYEDKIIKRKVNNNIYLYEVYYYNDDLNYVFEFKIDNFNEELFLNLLKNNEIDKVIELVNNIENSYVTKLNYNDNYKRKIRVNIFRKGVN